MTDPLALSYYLLLPLALALSVLTMPGARIRELRLALTTALVSVIAIAFTISRVPIVLAAVMIVGAIARVALRNSPGRIRRRSWAVGAVAFMILVLCGAGASMLTRPGASGTHLRNIGPFRVRTFDPSIAAHLGALQGAGDWHKLVLGQGLGTTGELASAYASTGYEDVYLDTAGQVGLLGVATLIAWIFLTSRGLVARASGSMSEGAGLRAVLVLLALAGVASSQLLVLTSLGITWLVVGTIGLPARSPQTAESDPLVSRSVGFEPSVGQAAAGA